MYNYKYDELDSLRKENDLLKKILLTHGIPIPASKKSKEYNAEPIPVDDLVKSLQKKS